VHPGKLERSRSVTRGVQCPHQRKGDTRAQPLDRREPPPICYGTGGITGSGGRMCDRFECSDELTVKLGTLAIHPPLELC
jgi:hypothetical protein